MDALLFTLLTQCSAGNDNQGFARYAAITSFGTM
jgi:hypothetical protein